MIKNTLIYIFISNHACIYLFTSIILYITLSISRISTLKFLIHTFRYLHFYSQRMWNDSSAPNTPQCIQLFMMCLKPISMKLANDSAFFCSHDENRAHTKGHNYISV